MPLPDRHLDLGCGKSPRNPYQRAQLCGVDIQPRDPAADFDCRTANLAIEPIPFPDNHFGSVSAFDFIEHIPRILVAPDRSGTRFPFVQLMGEIWRVLAPGGRFYALTPAYPHLEAFTDPTHVNIITVHTHEYFCGPEPLGRMYGFTGDFRALRVRWTLRGAAYGAIRGSADNYSAAKRTARRLRALSRWMRGKQPTAKPPYLLWELEATKPA
ncbi:MAG: class I SAM-dependent methyltransferase [Rhodanobacteraceae bacterium]|nr:MAG: class I SAM-dependent methyltransferase [Rhodanobacteraceae bacterium]